MINFLHHTAISVRDIERSIRFYCDLLGLELEDQIEFENFRRLNKVIGSGVASGKQAMLRCGDQHRVELWEFQSPGQPMYGDRLPDNPPAHSRGLTHMCFDVTDIQVEYARLSEAGVQFHCEPQKLGENLWATYGRDPDGNVFELQELL